MSVLDILNDFFNRKTKEEKERQKANDFQKLLELDAQAKESIRKSEESLNRSLEEVRLKRMFKEMEEKEWARTRERIRNPKSIYLRHKK